MEIWDQVEIIEQLTPREPIGTIKTIIDIQERDKGLQWRWWKYHYILEWEWYYWEEHIKLFKKHHENK